MQTAAVPQPVFLNVEFIFSWLWGHVSFIFTREFFSFLQVLATIIVIFGITVILYCLVRLYEIKQDDKKKSEIQKMANESMATADTVSVGASNLPGATVRNETWEHIREKLLSDNPSDWRLAIIEADIYMDKLLDTKGFHGDTTGDKLKSITPDQLGSVQIAWEAHKVRNRIAHDGASFSLTQPEARRVLSYFEIVFRDLGAIQDRKSVV